ncbi:MAG: hypothetical protein LBV68_03920 [Spirochaetaceae bacterium]|jgi:hypothetical protein|nr:hypothetical protein [Spirochaetaceae bacterium]
MCIRNSIDRAAPDQSRDQKNIPPAREKPVNILFKKYKAGLFDKKELEAKIFIQILENPGSFGLLRYRDKSERADFLCWLYPRMSKSIEKFESTIASFDTYINSIVRYADKEFRGMKFSHYETECVIWDEKAHELSVSETEAAYCPDQGFEACADENYPALLPLRKGETVNITNPKQALVLLLKSYYFLTDDLIACIAPCLGMDKNEIYKLTDQLHKLRFRTERKIRSLREGCFFQHFRCMSFEQKLNYTEKDSIHYEILSEKIKVHRERLVRMRRRLKNMRVEASNSQIARVLGIAKGSVDSNLYAIKQRGIGFSV